MPAMSFPYHWSARFLSQAPLDSGDRLGRAARPPGRIRTRGETKSTFRAGTNDWIIGSSSHEQHPRATRRGHPMPMLLTLQTASSTPDAVVAAASAFTNFLLGYVGALAAVGALSMALIEA